MKRAPYRHRFDLLADILRVAGSGSKKTHIMFFANLSYSLLTRYLKEAITLGFLQLSSEQFVVTPKGEEFLARYSNFRDTSKRISADLMNLKSEEALLEQMCYLDSDNKLFKRNSRALQALG